jgi:AAA15 family ATPase/GTPase
VGVKGYHQQYVPVVNEEGTPHTLPMQHLGEGVNRLFGIAIALVSARDGFLLIDEIESGSNNPHHRIAPFTGTAQK